MLNHIQINVKNIKVSSSFYEKLFSKLGWKKFMEEKDIKSWTDGKTTLFLNQCEKKYIKNGFHRKSIGLNHIAFTVNSKKDIDKIYEFLKKNRITILYGGPKEYPEYCPGYYAVYFEDPDRIKLEVVHIPK